jgi:DNA adenine methylase
MARDSFVAYSAASRQFGAEAQKHLCDAIHTLRSRGVSVLMSNANTPRIRELYADCHIETVHARRSISANGDERGRQPIEVLVRTYNI